MFWLQFYRQQCSLLDGLWARMKGLPVSYDKNRSRDEIEVMHCCWMKQREKNSFFSCRELFQRKRSLWWIAFWASSETMKAQMAREWTWWSCNLTYLIRIRDLSRVCLSNRNTRWNMFMRLIEEWKHFHSLNEQWLVAGKVHGCKAKDCRIWDQYSFFVCHFCLRLRIKSTQVCFRQESWLELTIQTNHL